MMSGDISVLTGLRIREDSRYQQVEALAICVRPDWQGRKLSIKACDGGIINVMLCCHLVEDTDRRNAIMVRIYGNVFTTHAHSSPMDFLAMQLGYSAHCFPKILAVFENGVVYTYAPGRNLTQDHMKDTKVIRTVCAALARLHAVDPSSVALIDKHGQPSSVDTDLCLYTRMRKCLDKAPSELPDPDRNKCLQELLARKDVYRDEIGAMERTLAGVAMPVCLSHMDLYPQNIVYDPDTDAAFVVDMETAGFTYRSYDICSMFHTFVDTDAETVDFAPGDMWLCCYQEEVAKLEGNVSKPTQEEADSQRRRACVEHKINFIIFYLYWGVMLLSISGHNPTDFDPLRRSAACFNTYFRCKGSLAALRREHDIIIGN